MDEIMDQRELIDLFNEAASQSKSDQLHIRINPAERKMLAMLARAYSKPMAQVVLDLVRQAAVDYVQSGEVLGLSKY